MFSQIFIFIFISICHPMSGRHAKLYILVKQMCVYVCVMLCVQYLMFNDHLDFTQVSKKKKIPTAHHFQSFSLNSARFLYNILQLACFILLYSFFFLLYIQIAYSNIRNYFHFIFVSLYNHYYYNHFIICPPFKLQTHFALGRRAFSISELQRGIRIWSGFGLSIDYLI